MPWSGFLFLLLLPCFTAAPVAVKDATEFLQSYGYIQTARLMAEGAGEAVDPKVEMEKAIKAFQQTAGLAVTGELDAATLEEMDGDRCGVPDLTSGGSGPKVWKKRELTYSIDNKFDGMSMDDTKSAIKEAFEVYEEIIPLTFEEVDSGEGDIKFSFGSDDHGLCDAFDGKGHALAHAFYPSVGKVHFDADESWTVMNKEHFPASQRDFLTMAIHEIGHALGLYHVRNNTFSIMAPKYREPKDKNGNYEAPKLRLDKDVISTLQGMYGTVNAPKTNDETETSCAADVYAVVELPYDQVMLFHEKGKRILEIATPSKRILQDVPVSEIFSKGPAVVKAAYYRDGMIMLFSGDRVWGYKLSTKTFRVDLAVGYPKRLPVDSEWKTEAAFAFDPKSMIVSANKTVAKYDERSNKVEIWGPINEKMKNFPEAGAGRARFNKKDFIYFTQSRVFTHNFNGQSTDDLGSISEFLNC